ncbi:MAG: peptide ABC transporter substrate-binding protein [Coriobacteriia bacterium]|nr:peptide ABC transporter substrate-binding protein [Coriobacteriia bacterium]
MRRSLKRFIVVPLAIAVTASLIMTVGCTPKKTITTGDGAGVAKGGTLSYYIGEPSYIDPYNAIESNNIQVAQALFDSLTAIDSLDPTKVNPAAATTWTVNADATVWTFKLDPKAKFHDGTSVTAADFIYAWNRIANPETINTSTGKVDSSSVSLAPIKGYEEMQDGKATELSGLKAIDSHTLQVTLSETFADFNYMVSHPALAPVLKRYVEGGVPYNGKTVPFGEMPVGNGPFKMSEPWTHDQSIKLVRNNDYYGTMANIDGVNFAIFKDPAAAFTEFKAGNLDFTQITEGQIKASQAQYGTSVDGYTANPGKQVLLGAENSTYFLVLNMKDSVVGNANLRKAISLAINRQAICDTVFEGTCAPADNIVPPGIAGYQTGAWKDSHYDVAAAKAALTAAGYPDGKGLSTITLSFNTGADHEKVMQLIQADLKVIGINTTFESADYPTYLKGLGAGKFQIGRLAWSSDYPIMDNFLFPLFFSDSDTNMPQYSDASVDTGINKARATVIGADRIAKYQAVNNTIQAANPAIPLLFLRHNNVTSNRVNNLQYSAQGLADFTAVWLTNGGK